MVDKVKLVNEQLTKKITDLNKKSFDKGLNHSGIGYNAIM